MNLKDAAANLNQAHPEDTLHPLFTPWGEMMMHSGSYDNILSEYPRPQMKRTDYHILNGLWEYAFVPADGSSSSEDPAYFTAQGTIVVPFSPEALLSGVHRRLEPTEYLWYHRNLTFSPEEIARKEDHMRCILHFDAVDQEATVFLGAKQLGTHNGGYLPFSLDITEYVNAAPVSLYVKVRDLTDTGYATRGKQTLTRGGMFYTAQSGIWQSVWYEWVPENYVINYKITPQYDKASNIYVCQNSILPLPDRSVQSLPLRLPLLRIRSHRWRAAWSVPDRSHPTSRNRPALPPEHGSLVPLCPATLSPVNFLRSCIFHKKYIIYPSAVSHFHKFPFRFYGNHYRFPDRLYVCKAIYFSPVPGGSAG